MEQNVVYHGEQQDSTEKASVAHIGFTPTPNAILYDTNLSWDARSMYTLIRSFMYGDKDACWPGQAKLAQIMGKTEKTVRGYLDELIDAGLLTKKRRGPGRDHGRTNLYTLTAAALKLERGAVQTLNSEYRTVNITDQDRSNFTVRDRSQITDKEDKNESNKKKRTTYSSTESFSVATTESKERGKITCSGGSGVYGQEEWAAPTARQFVAAVYSGTTPSGRMILDEVVKRTEKRTYKNADCLGSQYKQLVAVEDLTEWEYREVVSEVATELCSPQQALKDLRGEETTEDTEDEYGWLFTGSRSVHVDEDGKETRYGSQTPESFAEGQNPNPTREVPEIATQREMSPGLTDAVDGLLANDTNTGRLARSVIAGKQSPSGPVTHLDVARAIRDELDTEDFYESAEDIALFVLGRLRNQGAA